MQSHNQGQAYLLSGANGGLLATLDHPDPQAAALFGRAVAGVGDVSGDGVPDLLLGCVLQDVAGRADQGQAFVCSGADGSLLATLDNPGAQAGGQFGRAVAGIGDLNADSVPDLLVSAPLQDVSGNPNQGQVFLFSGADRSLLATLDHPSPQSGAIFGESLSGVGDTNGDGQDDLIVGARLQDVSGNVNQGQVILFVSVQAVADAGLDIQPGSDPNVIKLKSNGQIPVGILTTDLLDATTIDISTVRFGPAAAPEAHNRLHMEDLNGDGRLDAVLHFKTQETGIAASDTEACILFEMTSGVRP